MLRTKRDIVIAVCQVAPAHAIPGRDEARAVGNLQRETRAGAVPRKRLSRHALLPSTPGLLRGVGSSDHGSSSDTRSSTMPAMTTLTSALKHLEQERNRLKSQIENFNSALAALKGTSHRGTRTGTMSAAGRARIAAAQRARWAKVKGKKVVAISASKRKMSLAARRRIAAQKARWAKWRKAQKKG
jgi:hypothetical protein